MKELFIKLYEAFDTAKPDFTASGLPPVATIDRYRGQPLDPEAFEYFEMPAIFIGRTVQWNEEKGVWSGVLTLDFHIVMETFGDTGVQYTSHEQGLKYFSLLSQIRKVLDRFSTDFTSKLRRSSDREVDTGVIIYEVLSYTCDFWDDEAAQDPKYVDSENDDLEIRATLVKVLKQK